MHGSGLQACGLTFALAEILRVVVGVDCEFAPDVTGRPVRSVSWYKGQ